MRSAVLIGREALVIEGESREAEEQKIFIPPPVPVLSTTGALNFVVRPKCSATVAENGKTVEEPTMCMLACTVKEENIPMTSAQTTTVMGRRLRKVCMGKYLLGFARNP